MRFWAVLFLAAFCAVPFSVRAGTADFSTWLETVRQEAVQQGVSVALMQDALPEDMRPDPRVLRLDRKQPEKTITFEQYKKNVVTPARIREGRRQMAENAPLLAAVANTYGVEPEYIAALWGIETNYGANSGGFEIIPALATLAYEGRRAAFFRRELLQALRILQSGDITLHRMTGSWAGAMGQCQFMPSSFAKYAQDYDGDGHRDIWGSRADVFASIAAYLAGEGWVRGQDYFIPVQLPKNFDTNQMGIDIKKSVEQWRALGVTRVDGAAFPAGISDLASVVQPGGLGYKVYLVYGNYRAIMDWNRSTYFATAVGWLAHHLK